MTVFLGLPFEDLAGPVGRRMGLFGLPIVDQTAMAIAGGFKQEDIREVKVGGTFCNSVVHDLLLQYSGMGWSSCCPDDRYIASVND